MSAASIARRTLQVVAFILTLVVGVSAMAVIVSQTVWFKDWLRGLIVRQADDYLNGQLSIGRIDGNLLFGVELEDVTVTMDGKTVVAIKDAGIDYNVFTMLAGHVVLDDIRLNQPVFRIERTAEGWNITRLVRVRTPDATRGRLPIDIGEVGISDGTIYMEGEAVGTTGVTIPSRIERIDASVGISSSEDALTVDVGHVSLRTDGPAIGINALSGVIRRTRDGVVLDNVSLRTEESSLQVDGVISLPPDGTPTLDLTASSDKLVTNEIGRVVPALRGYDLQPAFDVAARGPLDRLSVDVSVTEAALGRAAGDLIVSASGESRRVAGAVSMEHFNVAPILAPSTRPPGNAITSDVTGSGQIDLILPSGTAPLRGTYTLNAARARVAEYEARSVVARGRIDGTTLTVNGAAEAYGGRATTAGTVVFGQPLRLDLRGRAAGVDLRRLPSSLRAPAVASDLQFAYTLRSRGSVLSGDVELEPSTLADATIEAGTTAQFQIGAGAPGYAAQGQVSNLSLQSVGEAFEITTLAEERFRSRINATFDMQGSGGGSYPLTLHSSGTLTDSTLFGATFQELQVTSELAEGDARVTAAGTFDGLDPAAITEDSRHEGSLSGTADVAATLRGYAQGVTIDSIDASGRVELEQSTIARLTVDRAAVEGTYSNREGQLAELMIEGPDLNVTGEGAVALNDTGTSNLALHVEAPSLERIGEIVGRPLRGGAVVDATVMGNARELRAEGTLQGSNAGYGDNRALSLDSTFAATVHDLDVGRASVQARSTATFVEIGGQTIRQISADATYAESQIDFEGTAQEGAREVEAAGSAVIHADHQEIHLASLVLRSEGAEWRTVPGAQPTVQYGDDRIAIANLQLVSGDQRIAADGALGAPDEMLRVRVENVDVAQLDRLVLGEQRIAGRLDAEATVSGPLREPHGDGTFTLSQGAFRDFTFDALTGTLDYDGRGVNLDVRMQQSPEAWITATGFAPLSLFRRNPPEVEGHEEPGAGEAVDIEITSSEIDLGLIQGFTSYLTNVTGALEANVRVTGTGHDPHFEGVIDVRGGAFEVPDLNTAYTGVDTRIALKSDAMEISEMRILDEHGNAMTIGGTIGVHERSVGAVNVTIRSENFEVIDNELADLKLDTDLRVTGELRAPRIVGVVEVESGTIDVARLLERVGADPYATESVAFGETALEPGAAAPPDGLLSAVDLEIGIAVPSSLILRGTDMRTVNAPIDFGDLNLTVGGAVQVRKPVNGQLRLIGEVNTVRGNYTFQGRRFDILRDGRIRFAGADIIDPTLDLRASRVISGIETVVRVQGTMRQPELSFSSRPPLDQADILSLIVFNMPINELGEQQQVSLAARAGALAGGYLASGLTRSIAGALELDEFEIQTPAEQGLAPTISIGEQVGERLFLRIRQGFGAAEATEFILEYQIAEFLRLQGAVAETSGGTQRVTFRRVERGGLDLIFFFSY